MVRLIVLIGLVMNFQQATSQDLHDERLEVVASFGHSQPIGVSVSSDNRVFVSFPNQDPYVYGLTEIINGERVAYPNAAWNAKKPDGQDNFVNVQDIYVDTDDQLWVLDAKPGAGKSIFGNAADVEDEGRFNLVQIDLKKNQVVKQYHFEDLNKAESALNDVRIDTDKKLAYLSDPGQAGIVVLDLQTGKSRLLLAGAASTTVDPSVILKYEGKELRDKENKPFRSNVNGIALTKDNKYFYFKPINTLHLYRIPTEFLADASLTDAELQKYVEDMGETAVTHGLIADKNGNIYLTSSLDYSIKRWSPDGKIETIVQDSRLIWPDSLGIGSDGYLYFSCAQVNKSARWNAGEDKTHYPYEVYRVKIL